MKMNKENKRERKSSLSFAILTGTSWVCRVWCGNNSSEFCFRKGLLHSNSHYSYCKRLFLDHVWKLHGLPTHIVLDRGPQFITLFTKELYHLLRIEIASFTAWYPHTNGQVEWVKPELKQYLWIFINKQQSDLQDNE